MKILKVKKLSIEAQLPKREYNSNGYDLYAHGNHVLSIGETKIIPCGIACELEPGYVALIEDRGSWGADGIHHFAGVIDSDYRGQWAVVLHNFSDKTLAIKHGDKIAQALIIKTESPEVKEVVELSETKRGERCLGSTDKGTSAEQAQSKITMAQGIDAKVVKSGK